MSLLDLKERLEQDGIIIGDGALGTMLMQKGLKSGGCPELMNIENPTVLEEIASAYVEAGADFVTSNTFGASPLKLEEYGIADRTEEIVTAGVNLLKKAVGGRALIAGSVGPTGRIITPYGDTEPEEFRKTFEVQIGTMIDAGVDFVLIETMIDLNEAVIAVEVSKSIAPDIPVIATLTFDPTPRGFYTVMGSNIETAVKELKSAGVDVVGSNCGNGLDTMIEIAAAFTEASGLPVLIQSNAGLPVLENKKAVYPESAEYFQERMSALMQTGVKLIGGCCGTTPDHIRAIAEVVKN